MKECKQNGGRSLKSVLRELQSENDTCRKRDQPNKQKMVSFSFQIILMADQPKLKTSFLYVTRAVSGGYN